MRLSGSRRRSSLIIVLAVLVPSLASSSASANGIPGPFDLMHYIAYINYPFNGLLLLLLVQLAYRGRDDIPFGPFSFLVTFLLSVAAITFAGALLDGFLIYFSFPGLMFMAVVVGLVAGLISVRYLGFGLTHGAGAVIAFASLNFMFWITLAAADISFWRFLDHRLLIPICYVLLFILTIAFASERLRQTRVVTISLFTGNKGLERVDHGRVWEQAKEVLGKRTLNELLALCITMGVVVLLVPMMIGQPL
jgi:hypothetical protein